MINKSKKQQNHSINKCTFTCTLLKYTKPYFITIILSSVMLLFVIGTEMYKPILIGETIDDVLTNNKNIHEITQKFNDNSINIQGLNLLIDIDNMSFLSQYAIVEKDEMADQQILIFPLSLKTIENLNTANITIKNDQYLINEKLYSGIILTKKEIKMLKRNDIKDLLKKIFMYLILILFGVIVSYVQRITLHSATQKIIFDIRKDIFLKLHTLSISYYDSMPIGKLITIIMHDTETLSRMFSDIAINSVINIMSIMAIVIMMFLLNTDLAICISLAILIMLVITAYYRKYSKESWKEIRDSISKLNVFLSEHIASLKIIKIFAEEERISSEFNKLNTTLKNANVKFLMIFGLFPPTLSFMQIALIALVLWYSANQYAVGGVSIGMVVIFLQYVNKLSNPIQELSEQLNILQSAIVSGEQIFDLLENDSVEIDYGTMNLPTSSSQAIEFKNVWFKYNEEEWILKDVSFYIKSGESVAIVGKTGAGKTTIINLLTRSYEITKGEILFNGINIDRFKKSQLRQYIGQMMQDDFIFTGDIFKNVKLFNDSIKDSEIIKLSKKIGAHEFISRLPNKYNEEIGNGGTEISTGQKQLLSILRTLAYNPTLIILDEATSSIDPISERIIQYAINEIMKDKTSIIIAHRLSTIKNVDKIIVIDKGTINDIGNHEELKIKNGLYTQLCNNSFYTSIS